MVTNHMTMKIAAILTIFLTSLSPIRLTTDLLEQTDKAFEYGATPKVRSTHPTFGWEISSDVPSTLQSSCRVLVATSEKLLKEGKADIWDSGMMSTDNCSAIKMGGPGLQPSTNYCWTVKIKDNHGNESGFAKPKHFTTAAELDGVQPRYPVQKYLQEPVRTTVKDGVMVADFGTDAYSQIRLQISSKEETQVTIFLGEKMKDGAVDRQPGGTIRVCSYDVQVHKGTHVYNVELRKDGRNSTIVPSRDHNPVLVEEQLGGDIYPFRYCEVDGLSKSVKVKSIQRFAAFYPFNDQAAAFSSSDPVLDAVWELCRYSMKATSALGVYIDGDRERIPYEADALINQLSHYSSDKDFSLARYSVDYLCRHATWPTEWILQAILMVWNDYMYTGNEDLLRRNYDILKARTLSDLRQENGLVSTRKGQQTEELMRKIGYAGTAVKDIVDWPQSGAVGVGKKESGEADGYVFNDFNAVVNAFHYRSLMLMEAIAEVLGEFGDVIEFGKMASKTYDAFNEVFWNGEGYVDGESTTHRSLHANMMPLAFGLVPEERKATVLEFIHSRGMACSVYGAQFLLDALYEVGDGDYALDLMATKNERGWYHMIELGSTITLEAWDMKYKPNLDWNHAWGAAPANVIPRGLFGIKPTEPGFRRFSVRPQLGHLSKASLKLPTIRGTIECNCTAADGSFNMTLTVPAGTEATVTLPDGKVTTVGSGEHSLSAAL